MDSIEDVKKIIRQTEKMRNLVKTANNNMKEKNIIPTINNMYEELLHIEEFKNLSDKYEENLNNLMNIFLNNKIEDSIKENKNIENEFIPIIEIYNRK